MLRPILAVVALVVGIFIVIGTLVDGAPKLWLGMMAGGAAMIYIALRESQPHHIEKWRARSEASGKQPSNCVRSPAKAGTSATTSPGESGPTSITSSSARRVCSLWTPNNLYREVTVEEDELRVRPIEVPVTDRPARSPHIQ